jgi:hypothetical protein
LLAGFLVISSWLAELSVCLQMVFNAIPLGGSSWYGDGKWLGSLPGWYASMSMLLALTQLNLFIPISPSFTSYNLQKR